MFGQILLNQGAIEQVFNDHLNSKGNIRVEWNKEAESLHFQAATEDDGRQFPVAVGVKDTKGSGMSFLRFLH